MAATSTELTLPDGLVAQLGFYFSESNLRRDRFLLRLTGADGTGGVPVATLATFNRVAALTTDEAVLARALRSIDSLVVSDDGASVRRAKPLPAVDTSPARTVYVENMPAGCSIETLRELFAPCGAVAHVAIPRCVSRDTLGFAFVEFEREEDAAAAADAMDGKSPSEGQAPLRVLLKAKWESQKRVYKVARGAANAAAAAREAEARAAAEQKEVEAAGMERTVVVISGIKRGGNVKAIRREIVAVFGAVAPVDYVDYGISNSGDPSMGYVRVRKNVPYIHQLTLPSMIYFSPLRVNPVKKKYQSANPG